MRTAIATLIVALAVGTAQAEGDAEQAPGATPGTGAQAERAEPGTVEPKDEPEAVAPEAARDAVEPEAGPASAETEPEAVEPAAAGGATGSPETLATADDAHSETATTAAAGEDMTPDAHDEPSAGPAESECVGSPVPVRRLGVRGSIWVYLADCKGQPFAAAAQALSALAVPLAPRADAGVEEHEDEPGSEAQPKINPELLVRLQRVAERYPGRTIEIVSGYRTRASAGSRHRHFDALDIHVEGVSNEELSAFARTFEATGVGYYPNSSFVHLDVREVAAYWVDESGPGEPAKYARKEVFPTTAGADFADLAPDAKAIEPTKAADAGPVVAAKAADETKDPVTDEPVAAAQATAEPAETPVTAEPDAAPAAASHATDSPQLASIAERALVVMNRALSRAGVQDTAL